MKSSKHVARLPSRLIGLPTAVLLFTALLLTACSATPTPTRTTTASLERAEPDGVQRILAANARHVIFEGLDTFDGAVFPDGRVWALERATGELRLLTTTESFGDHFFASGAALTPDGESVVIKVNRTNDGDNLYRIDLATGRATFITDAETLGLTQILEDTLLVSPEGERLAFSAYSEQLLDIGQPSGENFVWLMGVYVLEPGDPVDTLKLVGREDLGGTGERLIPYFDAAGRPQVSVAGESATLPAQPLELGPKLSLEELQHLPLQRLKALEDRALALE